MRRFSIVCTVVAISTVLGVGGCSDGKTGFVVKGSVSCQGKPLTSGVVRFHMADNRMAMAMIQPDGSFEATDVFPGEAKVTIEEDPAEKQRRAMPPPAAGAPKPPATKPSPPIPNKYKDVTTTDLVFSLKAGEPLNIELK